MYQVDVVVRSNKKLKRGYGLLELESKKICSQAKPGQFVHIHCPAKGVFFRRPFCIADVKLGCFSVIYKIIGSGTEFLARRKKSDTLNVLGPLGSCYKLPSAKEKIVFVSGGSGIASLNYLACAISPLKGVLYYGARTAEEFVCLKDFARRDWDIKLSTDDGSLGKKGYVSDLLSKDAESFGKNTVAYMCGPEAMQKAVAEFLIKKNIKFYCSKETVMACGLGVCQGCAVKTKNKKHALCCKDGPVFDGSELDWD